MINSSFPEIKGLFVIPKSHNSSIIFNYSIANISKLLKNTLRIDTLNQINSFKQHVICI